MESILDYDIYIKRLLKYMSENSGKHSINKIKANEWVNAQPIPEARNVASKLIDVIEYVSFDDIHKYIEKLITTHYKKIQDNKDNIIHMFIGEKADSNYFLSMLGLYYIKKNNYREPTLYFDKMPISVVKLNIDNTRKTPILIYIDDKSYSGGQIEHTLTTLMFNMYNNYCVEVLNNELNININQINIKANHELVSKLLAIKSSNFIIELKRKLYDKLKNYEYYNINFLLLGINTVALHRVGEYNYKYIYNSFTYYLDIKSYIDLPLKIHYDINYAKKYNTLDYFFNEEELFHIGYYFSVGRIPPIAIYYDHTIADDTSTILKILNYGPVVPENYDVVHYWKNFKNILNAKINNFIQKNYYVADPTKLFYNLCHKYYKKIMNNKYQNIRLPIKCIPFINNCYDIKKIISNPLMKYINYVMLILFENRNFTFYKFKEQIHNSPIIFSSIELLNQEIRTVDINLRDKLTNFINNINSHRCNLKFYKNCLINNNITKYELTNKNCFLGKTKSKSKTKSKTKSK